MSFPVVRRALVTGGAGTIGSAVVRIFTRDPAAWEVRVSDRREAPGWMRDTCEVRPVTSARRTLRHIDDIADGIVTAMVHPAGENVGFNISASEGTHAGGDRADRLGGVWTRPRRVRARAPSEFQSGCPASLAAEERLDLRGRIAGPVDWVRGSSLQPERMTG